MKTRVDRLRAILNLAEPVIPRKTTLPVLKNVLLKDGQVIATDSETMIILDYPEAEGEYLIPHRLIKEFLRHVPGDASLTIEQLKDKVRFSWNGGNASYNVGEIEDYPPIPEVEEGIRGFIDGDMLVPNLKSVVAYCATEETRPVLTGVSLSFNESFEIAAGDGFRMAYQTLPISFPAEGKVIIPAHAVNILDGLWGKAPPTVPLADSIVSQVTARREIELALGNVLRARFGQVTMLVRPIEGSAPNFSQLIPQNPPITIRVFAPELERAVRRCAWAARDTGERIHLNWTEDVLTVSVESEDSGSVETQVPVQAEGGQGKIAINVNYLLQYLGDKDGIITIGVTSDRSPILFRHGSTPLVVIMPMIVNE